MFGFERAGFRLHALSHRFLFAGEVCALFVVPHQRALCGDGVFLLDALPSSGQAVDEAHQAAPELCLTLFFFLPLAQGLALREVGAFLVMLAQDRSLRLGEGLLRGARFGFLFGFEDFKALRHRSRGLRFRLFDIGQACGIAKTPRDLLGLQANLSCNRIGFALVINRDESPPIAARQHKAAFFERVGETFP